MRFFPFRCDFSVSNKSKHMLSSLQRVIYCVLMGYVCVSNTNDAAPGPLGRPLYIVSRAFWYSFPLIIMIIRKMAIFILHPRHNHYIFNRLEHSLRGKMQPIHIYVCAGVSSKPSEIHTLWRTNDCESWL